MWETSGASEAPNVEKYLVGATTITQIPWKYNLCSSHDSSILFLIHVYVPMWIQADAAYRHQIPTTLESQAAWTVLLAVKPSLTLNAATI